MHQHGGDDLPNSREVSRDLPDCLDDDSPGAEVDESLLQDGDRAVGPGTDGAG